jgi:hypothetical protein
VNRVALRLLLLLYPRAWRARYGQELRYVIVRSTAAGRSPWRIGADVARAAAVVRAQALGIVGGGLTRHDRATGGCVFVLWAWIAFVIAGAGLQKASEHWQGAVPTGERGLATVAFTTVIAAAVLGTVVVLAGVAVTVPRVVAMLVGGGWSDIRRPVWRAVAATVIASAWTLGLAIWAHRLGPVQRNGGDPLYEAVVMGWGLSVAVTLAAWTAVASLLARQIELGHRLLVTEAVLAAAATGAMAVMSVATLVWWRSVGAVAPGFVGGGSVTTPVTAAVILMAVATVLGAAGTARAARALDLI